jgi:hypothetical protein
MHKGLGLLPSTEENGWEGQREGRREKMEKDKTKRMGLNLKENSPRQKR